MDAAQSTRPIHSPLWVTIVRGFQLLVSLGILGLAGRLIHDVYLDEFGLAAATAVLTWAVLFYLVTTERISDWRVAYNVYAALALEAFMVVMWLATFAATAARRATFNVLVDVDGCVNNGGVVNSKYCYRKRDAGAGVILFRSGAIMMSSIAGLGAWMWLMFIATFVWTIVVCVRARRERGATTASNTYQMEPKTEQPVAYVGQPQPQPQPQQHYQQQTGEYQHQQHQQQQYTGEYQHQQHQQTGEYQPSPMSPYHQQPVQAQHPPQVQQVYQSHNAQSPPPPTFHGSELSAESHHPQQQPYGSPSPVTVSPSPAPQQHPPHQ